MKYILLYWHAHTSLFVSGTSRAEEETVEVADAKLFEIQ